MDKLITFCVPSYNSEAYLNHALDSLLPGGDKIEVLIIDDGSSDKTLDIAKDYERRYPDIFKAVHQENKGHGGAINTALSLATGCYFKVLDSDDWVSEDGLKALMENMLRTNGPDLILMPYVYRHSYDSDSGRAIKYDRFIHPNEICSWDKIKRFDSAHNLTLHSVVYKTSVLKEAGVILPEHCFYEDNYFIYAPLPYTNKILYIDEPFYQYLLGREGQSMQTKNIVKRSDNLAKVARLAFNAVDLEHLKKKNKSLFRILRHQLVMMIASYLLFVSLKSKEDCRKEKGAFVSALKKDNLKRYRLLLKHPYVYFPSQNNQIGEVSSKFMLWAVRKYGAIN